jgi:hypothetical protein
MPRSPESRSGFVHILGSLRIMLKGKRIRQAMIGASSLGLVATGFLAAGVTSIAQAAGGSGVYAEWTQAGSAGTLVLPSAGFAAPAASWTTNGGSLSISTGSTIWLGPTTPFGARYGSSQSKPYLSVGLSAGSIPSATTYTFTRPTPVGTWSFAFGDIDADFVTLSATDANGNAVTTFSGWYQGGFNYCDVSPKPSGCPAGTHTDVPTWFDDTATLVGSGSDTHGAAGWFTPTVSLSSLTFTFDKIVGIPTFQTWFAGDGPAAPSATTTAATTVADTTAMLNATVNANYTASTVSFRYALDAAEVTSGQGSVIAAVPGAVAGGDSTAVNAALSGLIAATTYFYRVEVDPGTGAVVTGAVESFTTAVPIPLPPTAPGKPVVEAGDGQITATWTAPEDEGSAAVSTYTATTQPSGGSCTVAAPALTCTLENLVNDTSYTVTVVAQSNAGTSPSSEASDPVTPTPAPSPVPSIVISGSRMSIPGSHDRITVDGTTKHIEIGTVLTPMVSLDGGDIRPGVGLRMTGAEGDFVWTRQVATQRDVTIAFTDGVLTSNTLVFAVTPGIMISGSRDGGRVKVSGVTEHLPRGTELTPIVSFDGGAQREGVNIRRIDARGEFTWQRRVGDSRSITVEFTGGGATSNALTWAAP